MKVLIYGAGGVGGYFGGKIAQSGQPVTMIARGDHLKAIKRHGLKVESIKGDFNIHPELVTDNLQEIDLPDLVILGVKSWQLENAAIELKKVTSPKTLFLPLQNGASNITVLSKFLPSENILGGLCKIVSFIKAPGLIKHSSFDPEIIFGEQDNSFSERIQGVKRVFDTAQIKNTISQDIVLEIWKKFLFISTISGLGGLTRVPLGKIRESEFLYETLEKTAREIINVANAKGISLGEDHFNAVFEIINKMDPDTTASAQRDIMDGRPSELENFNGYIVKEGKKLKIPTPVNTFIYECLLPMEAAARKGKTM